MAQTPTTGGPRPGAPHAMHAAHAPASGANPWLVLMVLCGGIFMLLLDTTIVNVAQQKIKEGLNADLTQIQWILDAYILTYAVFLLSFGRMGDVLGRKRLFIVGMAIFTAASGLCAVSSWLGDLFGVSGADALIIARVLQGFGGALMMPQTLSLLTVVFPPEKRGAAMGIWGGVVALGAVVGPIFGGLIVTNYAWEWVFLINIPVGIAAIWATFALVPESIDPLASKRIDWGGLVLSGGGIFALVFAAIEGNDFGWTDPLILGLAAAGALLLIAFVWWEGRVADPMMKLELFRLRNFWVGNVITTAVAFGMLGIFFPMTLFLQGALGFSPIKAGLTMTPMSVMIMIAAPIAGRLTDRLGARWILVSGLALMTGGVIFLASRITVETDWLALLPALIITGVGMGMTFAPMTAAAMAEVPPRIAGSASGILNTMRNVGQVLGIAVLGSLLQSRLGAEAENRLTVFRLEPATEDRIVELVRDSQFSEIAVAIPASAQDLLPAIFGAVQQAFVDGLRATFLAGAAACAVAALTSFMIHNPRRRSARVEQPAAEAALPAAAD